MIEKKNKLAVITMITLYPFVLILITLGVNFFILDINPILVALPNTSQIQAFTIAVLLLIINHTWLMTTTELTRVEFNMFATPEERDKNNVTAEDAPIEGVREIEKRHNAHRNTTENTIYFIALAFILLLVSASKLSTWIWCLSFPLARLGYTYSYISGNESLRGLFMSISLLVLYGISTQLILSMTI